MLSENKQKDKKDKQNHLKKKSFTPLLEIYNNVFSHAHLRFPGNFQSEERKN